ncbi:hypothetical protein Tco_1015928 [Tanacetum coccineum]|uniref:Uncharacterized protein n=1 Tax=Tanacetum coccineum TaxID=301880 RepID=A0ABQ5FND0_9ASTR
MNYYEPNLCYESNYSGFDQFETLQHPVIHQPIQEKTCAELLAEERAANIDQSPPQEMSIQDIEDLKQHYLDEMKSLINDLQIKDYRNDRIDIQYRRECEIKIYELKQNFNGMSIEIRKKEKELLQQEQGVENRYMVTLVDGVLANGVVMIFEMDIAFYAIQGTEILSLMIRLRILSIILPIFHTTLYNPNTCHTLMSYMGTMPIMVTIVHLKSRLSLIRNHAAIKTMMSSHKLYQYPVIHHPPQEMSIQDMEDLKQQYLDEMKSLINEIQIKDYRNEKIDIGFIRECEIKINELKENFIGMSIEINKKKKLQQLEQVANLNTYPSRHFNSFCYDDDDEKYTIAITPVLPTVEPDNSLSMGDEHLSTIPEKEESSVEDLVPIPSESEGVSYNMCDVPFHDNSPPLDISKDQFEDFFDSNDDSTSIDDDSFSIDDIDYVEASPPDSELVSLEEVKDLDPEDGGINDDILLIKDDILREKLLNIHLLIAKIEALKDNLTPSSDDVTKSPSTSPNFFLEETTFLIILYPNYEAFFCDSEPDSGNFTMDVVEDIFDNPTREPRVHVPNVFAPPTPPPFNWIRISLFLVIPSDPTL